MDIPYARNWSSPSNSGPISSRGAVPAGGVRSSKEQPSQFYNRMDSRNAMAGMQQSRQALTPFTQRQVNIAASRAAGDFDAKRNAYNAANSGSFMDTQGNIGPKAPPVAGTSPAMGATQPTPQRPGGPKTVSMGGQFGSGKVDPDIMGPRKPATFDGKSRESFFTDAAKRQGVGNAYAAAPKPDLPSPAPTGADIKPDPKMAALGKAAEIANSRETAATMAKATAPTKPFTAAEPPATPTPAGVPKPTFDDPDAKERYNKAMAFLSGKKPFTTAIR